MPYPVAALNALSSEQASELFLSCCGSKRWVQGMVAARPFSDMRHLKETATQLWWSLGENDWLEAFAAHPKIGEKKAAAHQSNTAQAWSAQEQKSMEQSSQQVTDELATLNKRYHQQFGFIFIICATGKSSQEMLATLKKRIQNDRPTEIKNAANEQLAITQLRLEKGIIP